ncbi:MAG: DUF2293 domain-containing protein [Planctomycetaceae bacterium]|nr:DUF2293 domain-containing protein [Planctomycetaceae bacterium]
MPLQSRVTSPGPSNRTVRTDDGQILKVPDDWACLPPGDPGLTRRVKAAGPSWTVQEKKGRKVFSRGVWAPAETIEQCRRQLESERSTEQYAKRRASDAARREKKQDEYVEDFHGAVMEFLDFATVHNAIAVQLAHAVTQHATPVGSGTVARTQRIPLERRAEAAVIAWLRHQTTAYDDMKIPRVAGMRREVRRMLAEKSRSLLERYRKGLPVDADCCPLQQALTRSS